MAGLRYVQSIVGVGKAKWSKGTAHSKAWRTKLWQKEQLFLPRVESRCVRRGMMEDGEK